MTRSTLSSLAKSSRRYSLGGYISAYLLVYLAGLSSLYCLDGSGVWVLLPYYTSSLQAYHHIVSQIACIVHFHRRTDCLIELELHRASSKNVLEAHLRRLFCSASLARLCVIDALSSRFSGKYLVCCQRTFILETSNQQQHVNNRSYNRYHDRTSM